MSPSRLASSVQPYGKLIPHLLASVFLVYDFIVTDVLVASLRVCVAYRGAVSAIIR
jgi:hypothetical protein